MVCCAFDDCLVAGCSACFPDDVGEVVGVLADCEVADGVAWQAGVPDGGGVAGESGLAGFEEPFVAEAVCGEAGLESGCRARFGLR